MRQIKKSVLRIMVVWLVSGTGVGGAASLTATLEISPSVGTETVGVPFTLDVDLSNFSGDGSTPATTLNNYTFDLLFNPNVFAATQAQVGTIFGPNDGVHGIYIPGAIDNANGDITFNGGIDATGMYSGKGGLLGVFTFVPLATSSGATFSLNNVALQSLALANSGLPGSDVDVGTLPTVTLSVTASTSVPEPASSGLLLFVFGASTAWALLRVQLRSRKDRCQMFGKPVVSE
jgi:hypothetical protein